MLVTKKFDRSKAHKDPSRVSFAVASSQTANRNTSNSFHFCLMIRHYRRCLCPEPSMCYPPVDTRRRTGTREEKGALTGVSRTTLASQRQDHPTAQDPRIEVLATIPHRVEQLRTSRRTILPQSASTCPSTGPCPSPVSYASAAALLFFFFCSTLSNSARLMCGRTPPKAIVARIRVSSSSSPRMASWRWRGVIRLTLRSLAAFYGAKWHVSDETRGVHAADESRLTPASSSTSAVRYSSTAVT